MLLESRSSKKCLQIRPDSVIDALGLAEPSSEYTVFVTQTATEQLYSFSRKQAPGVHISIQQGALVPGSGPIEQAAQFRAHLVPPSFVALESVAEPGHFIGQLSPDPMDLFPN